MSAQLFDRFEARLAIERLIGAYAQALDAGDLDKVSALFARGRIRINGLPVVHEGAEAVKQMFLRFTVFYDRQLQPADPTRVKAKPWTKHVSTNLRFEALNCDKAVLWSDFTVLQGFPGEVISPIVSGRYCDRFAVDNGDWFFEERLEYIDLIGDVSRHLKGNPLG